MNLSELSPADNRKALEEILDWLGEKETRNTPIAEQVYQTLTGQLKAQYRVPWVEPVLVPGHPCYEACERMYDAYDRLRVRLGGTGDDCDVEELIDSLPECGELLALKMFAYGRQYQQMQDARKEK